MGDVIQSFASPAGNPAGLVLVDDRIYLAQDNAADDRIFVLDLKGRVLRSFTVGGFDNYRDVAFDGKYLYSISFTAPRIILKFTLGGVLVNTYPLPTTQTIWLSCYKKGFWGGDHTIDEMYRMDSKFNITKRIPWPGATQQMRQGTVVGRTLVVTNLSLDQLLVIDFEGNLIKRVSSPGQLPTGNAFDGKHLWHCDWTDRRIYQLDWSAV